MPTEKGRSKKSPVKRAKRKPAAAAAAPKASAEAASASADTSTGAGKIAGVGKESSGAAAASDGGVNKAAEIRREFESQGVQTPPRLIIAALAGRGIRVAPAQVSNIKASLLSRDGKSGPRAARGSSGGGDLVSTQALIEARKLVDAFGSIEAAHRALDLLASLR